MLPGHSDGMHCSESGDRREVSQSPQLRVALPQFRDRASLHSTGRWWGSSTSVTLRNPRVWAGWWGGRTCQNSDISSTYPNLFLQSFPTPILLYPHFRQMCSRLLMCLCPVCFLHMPGLTPHRSQDSLASYLQCPSKRLLPTGAEGGMGGGWAITSLRPRGEL